VKWCARILSAEGELSVEGTGILAALVVEWSVGCCCVPVVLGSDVGSGKFKTPDIGVMGVGAVACGADGCAGSGETPDAGVIVDVAGGACNGGPCIGLSSLLSSSSKRRHM